MSRIIHFEGRRISVPDDATDDEVRVILSQPARQAAPADAPPIRVQGPDGAIVEFPAGTSDEVMTNALRAHYGGPGQPARLPPLPPGFTLDRPAAQTAIPPLPPGFTLDAPQAQPAAPVTPGGVPIGSRGLPRVEIGAPPPLAVDPNVDKGLAHNFAVGAQGVGAGVRDVVLAPFDLAAGATNLVAGGINRIFGTEIPAATPASQLADSITEPFAIPQSEMSPQEKLGYNISRFGTQALGGGAALSTRAPAIAEAAASGAKPATDFANRTLDTLARPYQAAPTRALIGDTIGGAGAGAAVNAADDYLPKEPATPLGHFFKNAANFIAPLLGGIGATTLQGAIEGAGGMARNFVNNRRADVNIPVRETGQPYSRADAERAATEFQSRVQGEPASVADVIRKNAGDLTNPTQPGETPVAPNQLPTTGLLSRDPGLVAAETGARVKNGADFTARDQNVKGAAGSRVEALRDPGADQGAVRVAATGQRDRRITAADAEVDRLRVRSERMGDMFGDWSSQFNVVANSDAKATASRNLDRTIVDEGYVPARAEKNRQFDEAPGRTEVVDAAPVIQAVQAVRARVNQLGPENQQLPGEFVQRLEQLAEPGATVDGGTLADLRKYINTARQAAQQAGNFDLADNIGTLGQAINRTIETAPGYTEANANYRQFADRFRPERGDEMAKFTRELDRSGNTDGAPNRGSTPPSETAGRFLTSPEKAQALQRVLDGAPNAAAGQAAVRDYMRSDFAMSALNSDGTINPARAAAWSRNNADVLAQFPQLRQEFDQIAATARRGEQLSNTARTELDAARKTRNATEADIDRSAVGTLLKEDPRDVASKILSGGYGAERRLDEIAALVKSDPAAARGWKAAVSEVLTDRVQSTRKVGETPEVQYARLAKEFKDNEAVLAKVYSPEEMNNLRQAHKLLEYFKEAEKRPTSGSPTAERSVLWRTGELALRHIYGDLKGGGIIRRMKLLADMLPNNKQSVEEITRAAWFNPDVAAYLLEKKVADPNAYYRNVNLGRLIAAANASRESGIEVSGAIAH